MDEFPLDNIKDTTTAACLISYICAFWQVKSSEAASKRCKWFGNYACKASCVIQGHSSGACDEHHECICTKKDDSEAGSKRCKLGGWACKASCKVLGRETGVCDENKKCVCSGGKNDVPSDTEDNEVSHVEKTF